MNIEILIMSREEITGFRLSGGDAVISFYDVGSEPVNFMDCGADVFLVELDDIDSDEPGFDCDSFFPQAEQTAGFILKSMRDGKRIICQCEYGMSRSAGCAAAILEHYEGRGIAVFADDRYWPNKAVFRKLLGALKIAHKV